MILKIFKKIIPIIFLFIFIFEIQRSFTNFPNITIRVLNSSVSTSMSNSLNIYSLLGSWSVFAYFTTLSNLIFIVLFVISWTFGIKISKYLKICTFIYITITTFIFWTTLAPFFNWGCSNYIDFINIHEHLLIFLMAFIWYFMKKEQLDLKKSFVYAIIFPIIYLIFALIIHLVSNNKIGIYPFLNFSNIFSANLNIGLSIFISILIILFILFVIFLLAFLLTNKKVHKKLKKIFKK